MTNAEEGTVVYASRQVRVTVIGRRETGGKRWLASLANIVSPHSENGGRTKMAMQQHKAGVGDAAWQREQRTSREG